MICLDEDLDSPALRAALKWYPGTVQAVTAILPGGLDDLDIVRRLGEQKDCLFVTNNTRDFWRRVDAHPRYCIFCIDAPKEDGVRVSELLRAALKAGPFASKRTRRGWIARVNQSDIRYYRRRSDNCEFRLPLTWPKPGSGHRSHSG